MTTVELQVNIDCAGCEDKVRKALTRLQGVDYVDIDRIRGKVTVTGSVDQKKVLKTVRRTGRTAVLWPYPYNPEYHAYAQVDHTHYYSDEHRPATATSAVAWRYRSLMANSKGSSYNYHVHGYHDSDLHGYYHEAGFSHLVSDATRAYFSDDNPNACSIM